MSIERNTRRAETAKELDRETWAGLDKIDYQFLVKGNGRATAGPFWFGRAFDAPPFFSFSAVARSGTLASQLTVGVAEWLQDEQGMYVGANLWVVFDACEELFPTGVVLNEGFETIIKRQGGGPEGNEVIAHGLFNGQRVPNLHRHGWGWWSTNLAIHLSQGWENGQGAVGFTPIEITRDWRDHETNNNWFYARQIKFGDSDPWYVFNPEMPVFASFDGEVVPAGNPGAGTYYQRTNWHVETTNPSPHDNSTHHIRSVQPAFNLAGGDFLFPSRPILHFGKLFPCSIPFQIFDWFEGTTVEGQAWQLAWLPLWRIEKGMQVRVSFDAFISKYDISEGFDDTINVFLAVVSKDGQNIGDVQNPNWSIQPNPSSTNLVAPLSLQDAEGEYVRYTTDGFFGGTPTVIHDDAYWLTTRLAWDANQRVAHGPYQEKFLDIDNLKLEIIGDHQSAQAPHFDVVLNFEGRILKNYSNIHPIEPFSHPTEVTLS